MNKSYFLTWVSTVPSEFRDTLKIIHRNISAILRVFNSSRQINTAQLNTLCRYSLMNLLLSSCHWLISRSHKLLAHCIELIETCNDGCGLKGYPEEALADSNKQVKRYGIIFQENAHFNLIAETY